jgi:glycosyltransferase involved in cell wall biosynthesis
MKIVFILPRVGMSGGIKVATIYAKLLVERGHEVVLISPPPRQIPLRSKVKSLLLGKGWPAKIQVFKSHLDGSGLDHRILNRWRPVVDGDIPLADVVVATWWETAEWVNNLSSKIGAKAYFVQGHEVFDHLPIDRVRATYRSPLHRIVVSNWLKKIMENQYGDLHTDLVPNSVDHSQFNAPIRDKQHTPTVGFLYSGSSFKGVSISLQVIKKIRMTFPLLRVISFGSVSVQADPDWDEKIEFEHLPPQEKLREIYAQCDVWISSSRTEGFNLTAMEAMSCRTPVVSTRTGWPEEAIINYKNGVLAEVDDVQGLSDAVIWILSQTNDKWKEISSRANETATACSWDSSVMLFEKALVRCIERTTVVSGKH